MGYYIKLEESNAALKAADLPEVLKRLHTMDKYEPLKSGGSYSNGGKIASWYAWMPRDLSELTTVQDFLEQVGFEVELDNDLLVFNGYDSKTGCEQEFIWAIAPFIVLAEKETDAKHPYMVWRGEDGSTWRWSFVDGAMVEQSAIVTWQDEKEYNPKEFGGTFTLTREMLEADVRA